MLQTAFLDLANRIAVEEKGQKSAGRSGLKRLGTIMSRRRSHMPYARSGSPERKKSQTNLGASLFGKGKSKESQPIPESPGSPPRRLSEVQSLSASRPSDVSGSPKAVRRTSTEKSKALVGDDVGEAGPSGSTDFINGTGSQASSLPKLQEPLQPTSPSKLAPEVR
jgi:F-BAR domain only protein